MEGIEKKRKGMEMIKMEKQSVLKRYLRSVIALVLIVVIAVPTNNINVFANGYSNNANDSTPQTKNPGGSESGPGVVGNDVYRYKLSVAYTSKGLFNGNETGILYADAKGDDGIDKADDITQKLFRRTSGNGEAVPLYTVKSPIGLIYKNSGQIYLPKSIRMFSKISDKYNADLKSLTASELTVKNGKTSVVINVKDELENLGGFAIGSIYFTGKDSDYNKNFSSYFNTNYEFGLTVAKDGSIKYTKTEAMKGRKIDDVSKIKKASEAAYKAWIDNYGDDAKVSSKTMDKYLQTFFSKGSVRLTDGNTKVTIKSISTENKSLYQAIYDAFTMTSNGTKFDVNKLFQDLNGYDVNKPAEALKRQFYSARNTLVAMTLLKLMMNSYKGDISANKGVQQSQVYTALYTWYKEMATRQNQYELAFVIEPFCYLRNCGSSGSTSAIITPNSYLAGWLKPNELSDFPVKNKNINYFLNTCANTKNKKWALPKDNCALKDVQKNIDYTFKSGYSSKIIGCLTSNISTNSNEDKYYKTFIKNKDIQTKYDKKYDKLAVGDVSEFFNDSDKYSSPISGGKARAIISKLVYTGYTAENNKKHLIKDDTTKNKQYSYARMGWGMLHTSDFINAVNPGTSAEMYTSTISLLSRDTKTIGSEYLGNTEDTGYVDKAKVTIDSVSNALQVLLPVMKSAFNNSDKSIQSKVVSCLLNDIQKDGKLSKEFSYKENGTTVTKKWSDVLSETSISSLKGLDDADDKQKLIAVSRIVMLAQAKSKGIDIIAEAEKDGVEVPEGLDKIINANLSALTIDKLVNGNTITVQSEILRVINDVGEDLGVYSFLEKLVTTIETDILKVSDKASDAYLVREENSKEVEKSIETDLQDEKIKLTNTYGNHIKTGKEADNNNTNRRALASLDKLYKGKELTTEDLKELTAELDKEESINENGYEKIYVSNKNNNKSNGFITKKNKLIIRNTLSNAGNLGLVSMMGTQDIKVSMDKLGRVQANYITGEDNTNKVEESNADKFGMSAIVMSSANVKFKLSSAYNCILTLDRKEVTKEGENARESEAAADVKKQGKGVLKVNGKSYSYKDTEIQNVKISESTKSKFKDAIKDKKGGISAEMSELQELIADYISDCNDFYLYYFSKKENGHSELKEKDRKEFNKLCKKELQIRLAEYLDMIVDPRKVEKDANTRYGIDKEDAFSERVFSYSDFETNDNGEAKDISEQDVRIQSGLLSKSITNWTHFSQYKLVKDNTILSPIVANNSEVDTQNGIQSPEYIQKGDAKTKYGRLNSGISIKIGKGESTAVKFDSSSIFSRYSVIKYNYNESNMKLFGDTEAISYVEAGVPINTVKLKVKGKQYFKLNIGSAASHVDWGKHYIGNRAYRDAYTYVESNGTGVNALLKGNKNIMIYDNYEELDKLDGIQFYNTNINTGTTRDNSFFSTSTIAEVAGENSKIIQYVREIFGSDFDSDGTYLDDFVTLAESDSIDYNYGYALNINKEKIQEIILKCVCIASLTKSETSVLVDMAEAGNDTNLISYLPASNTCLIEYDTKNTEIVNDTEMSAELASSTDGTIKLKDLEYVNAAQLSTSLVEDESLITGLFEYGDLNGSTQQLISGSRIWNSTIYGANAPVAQLTIEINSDKDGAPKEERDVKEWLQEKRKSMTMTDPNGNLFRYLIENQDIKVTYVKDAFTVPVGVSSGDMLVSNESTSLDKLVAVSVLPFNKENAYTTEATGNTYVGEDDLSNMLKTYTEIKDTVNKKGELVNGENAIKYKFNGVEQKQMNSTVVDCIEPETKMSLCVSNFEAKNKQVPTIVTIKIQKQSADRINVFLEKTSSSPSPQTTEQPKYKVGDVEVGKVTVREGKDKTTDSGETKFPTIVENRVDGPKYSRWVYKGNDADADREKVDATQYKLVYWGVVDGNHITNTTDKSKQTWAKTIRDKAETLKNKETFINSKDLKSKDWINKSATDRSSDNGYEEIQNSSSDGYATYGDTIVCIYEPLNDDPLRDAEVEGDFTLYDDEVSRYYEKSMRLSWENIRMDLVPHSFSWDANVLTNNNGTYTNGEFDKKDESFHGSNNRKETHRGCRIPVKDHVDSYIYIPDKPFIWKISNNIDTYENDKVANKNHVFGLKAECHTTSGSTFEIRQEQKQNGAIIEDAKTDTTGAATVNGAKEQLYSMYVTRMGDKRANTTDNLNVPSYKYKKDIEISNSSIMIKRQNVRKTSDNQRKESYSVDLGYNIANVNPTDNLVKDYKFFFYCSGYYIGKGAVKCDGCYTSYGRRTCNFEYTYIKTTACPEQTTTKTKGSISGENQKVGLQKISDDNAHVNGTEGYKDNRDRSLNNSLRLSIEVYEAAKKLNGDTKNGTGGFEAESGETINNISSTVLKYKDNISFYPYVKMQSSNNIGKSEKYYAILGDHRREIPRLDTIEIGWSKVDGNADDITADSNPTGYDSEHNLQITSKQWSTHSRSLRAFEDESMKNKVLPGGAVYQLSTGVVNKGSGDNKVKQDNSTQAVRVGVRTYNYFIPSGDYTTVNNDKEINGSDKDMEKLNTIPYNRSNVMTELKDAFNGSDWNAYSSGLSKSSAETKASNTIKGILRGLSQTEVQQIAATGRRTEAELLDATSDKEKYNRLYKTNNTIRAIDKSARKVFDRNLSELDKYWLNKSKTYKDMGDEIDRDSANSASLDVTNLKKTQYIYTVRSTVMGSVIVEAYKHNGEKYIYQGKLTMDKGTTDVGAGKIKTANGANATKLKDNIKEMNASCKLITNYISAIQRGEGQGHELLRMNNNKKVGTGEYTSGWYNEAFDGISVLVSEYVMDLGFYNGKNGEETSLGNIENGTKKTSIRSTALNVNLVGTQENKSDLYNFDELSLEEKVRTSMFITKPYIGSARNKYEEIASIGTKGSIKMSDTQWNLIESDGATAFPLKLNDMAKMYHSRTFYIPNATVMDLN